jgi:hypothetical protein
MNKKIDLTDLSSKLDGPSDRSLDLFAFLNLGLIEALMNGLLSAEDAVRFFYNADNCIYVKKYVKTKGANEVMGRGVQLPDLFDALPVEQARREFLRELAIMRELCLKIVEESRSVA